MTEKKSSKIVDRHPLPHVLHGIDQVISVIVVLSGKGGVGKSTVAANLAAGLAMAGKRVGLLDVDVHGPSIPRLMNLTDVHPEMDGEYIVPIDWQYALSVMSIGFLVSSKNDAIIWRGPLKARTIHQLAEEVAWGKRDVLVVDCPPGTGDEPLSVLQIFRSKAHAIIVTSPQQVAVDDVRRSISFCRKLGTPILGLIENFSGFVCPSCGACFDIFSAGGGERLAQESGIPFLGRIPIDQEVARAGDAGGLSLAVAGNSQASQAFKAVISTVCQALESPSTMTAQG